MGFPVHLDTMLRYCQAATQVTGQQKVTIGGLLAAVQGDKDTHNMMGDLQAMQSKITIQGKPMIVAMQDKGAPDMIGMLMHPITPTDPSQGSQKVSAYGGKGTAGMLKGLMNGKFNVQEMVKVGQQMMGKISSTGGGGSGSMALQGMTPGVEPKVGDTITGVETGATMVITEVDIDDKYNGTDYSPDWSEVNNYGVCDDYGIVVLDSFFTGLPSQNYQTENVVVNDS